jgi:hypothetical protein
MPAMSSSPLQLSAVPARRHAFTALLLLLFVGVSVHYSVKALQHRSAFVRWQSQILAMDAGEDIAKKFNYPNPPIMAVLLLPLAALPPVVGALAWFYLKVAMTLVAIPWTFRLVEESGRPFPPVAQVLTVLLSLLPILGDLEHGNVNLFILFLVVAALTALRARRDQLGGVLLALAISCKVTPALFVPYLVWKRAWRALAGVVLGLGLFLWPGVVPSLRLGFDENQRQLVSWYEEMVRPYVVEGKITSEHPNQSLPGLIARLATASPSFSIYVNNVYTPTEYDNFLNLDSSQARLLIRGCMLLFALTIVWSCRTPFETRSGWRLAAEYSLVLLGMLLFSERTWKHHCVTLLVPFAVLSYYLVACQPRRWSARALGAVLLSATGLMTVTSTVFDKDLAKQAQVYGAYTAAIVLLTAALVVLLRRGQDRSPPPLAAMPVRIEQSL